MEFFKYAVTKNINIRFILITPVLVAVVLFIISLQLSSFFFFWFFFLVVSGIFFPFEFAFFLFTGWSEHVLVKLLSYTRIFRISEIFVCIFFVSKSSLFWLVLSITFILFWVIISNEFSLQVTNVLARLTMVLIPNSCFI